MTEDAVNFFSAGARRNCYIDAEFRPPIFNRVGKDTSNCLEKVKKMSHLNQTKYLNYDRTLFHSSRPMRDKDTSALREMFQYSSLAEKPLDQWEIATD